MKHSIIFFTWLICLAAACGQIEKQDHIRAQTQSDDTAVEKEVKSTTRINPGGTTIESRFILPGGFERVAVPADSFASYLRSLPLKPHGSEVKFYNGSTKNNYGVYDAVVDIDIGTEDLQQCADAIMRLRGEYLFKQNRFNEIHFNFTNGFRVDFSRWIQGYRVIVKGNQTYWAKSASPSHSYGDFRNYMKKIFMYAGTLSLSKELSPVAYNDLQAGDIFIQGGSPGHAVIVVDLAVDTNSGKKIYLLAQSYMPAQDIQVLKNPMNKNLSPWYELDVNTTIIKTPEWTFNSTDLKRFAGEGGGTPNPIHGQPDDVLSGTSSQKFAEKTKFHKVLVKKTSGGWASVPGDYSNCFTAESSSRWIPGSIDECPAFSTMINFDWGNFW
jgi:hypothetical protein